MKVTVTVTERNGKCGRNFCEGDLCVLQSEEEIGQFCPNANTVRELKEGIRAALAKGGNREWEYTCWDHTVRMTVSVDED